MFCVGIVIILVGLILLALKQPPPSMNPNVVIGPSEDEHVCGIPTHRSEEASAVTGVVSGYGVSGELDDENFEDLPAKDVEVIEGSL